jgi:hypothetical protein
LRLCGAGLESIPPLKQEGRSRSGVEAATAGRARNRDGQDGSLPAGSDTGPATTGVVPRPAGGGMGAGRSTHRLELCLTGGHTRQSCTGLPCVSGWGEAAAGAASLSSLILARRPYLGRTRGAAGGPGKNRTGTARAVLHSLHPLPRRPLLLLPRCLCPRRCSSVRGRT